MPPPFFKRLKLIMKLIDIKSKYKFSGLIFLKKVFYYLTRIYKNTFMDSGKDKLKKIFLEKVYGKTHNIDGYNKNFRGAKGHWLEKQMGKKPDSDNNADFWGWECKNHTTSGKTTWGDWSANEYIFDKGNTYNLKNNDEFMLLFGRPNPKKNNRYAWTGPNPSPKFLNQINEFGQIIVLDEYLNVLIKYYYSKDQRYNKAKIMPKCLQTDDLILAKWYGYEKYNISNKSALETKVHQKFNQEGWFKCSMENNIYNKIVFGEPVRFETWIEYLKTGDIYFDSGMYHGNYRKYSKWRSNNDFWEKLITEEYPK